MKIQVQQGRTLIELMVVVAISLIITTAVAIIFLSVNRTSRYSGELSGIDDSGRIAMYFLGNAIRQAGYAEIVTRDVTIGSIGANSRANTLMDNSLHLAGCRNRNFADTQIGEDAPVCPPTAGAAFDSLMVSYQGTNVVAPEQTDITDCLGNEAVDRALTATHKGRDVVPDGVNRPMVQNFYFVVTGEDGVNTLMCRAGNAAAQALIPNIVQFRVYYGFDNARFASPDNPPAANTPSGNLHFLPSSVQTYVDATFLNDQTDRTVAWDHVVSVYVCIVIRSTPGSRELTTGVSTQFAGCPAEANVVGAALPLLDNPDGGVYRTYTQIFTIRSRATPNPSSFAPV
jgi:prepilin-type N-terminal cleavage/methylation domain-containing protein